MKQIFFNYLYDYCEANTKQPFRDNIELFKMNKKRQWYILEKCSNCGIWEYGINAFGGWFEPNALEIFNKKLTKE